ncbi:helix-turn-helix domain-containing protein [Acidomonas methanolica]|uniref:Helix-turn-helix domain-containing protein n=1 Tax=Acidomonas methanolica NBRC 104435 TaxID=1231351 RepID=A0A023D9T6_ACIMT|nr:helix-turn-helix domain-containing protein [Acidomonas methanolica]GAJ30586.1 hypothetical protein Amme_199_004 [Acidomonas methanolica NBRC 104435]GBQ46835.1 hypothetical protein AA0498_0382 [Acidomonas methanolica]GEK97505.1 hypothetical protein AME01nite_00040 [Acidomonas methanolica NBRC 104435]
MLADPPSEVDGIIKLPVFMTVPEAAMAVRRHPETLRRAIREGRLAAWRQRGCTLVSVADLMAYMEGFLCPAQKMKTPTSNSGAASITSSGGKRENDVDFRLAQRMRSALDKR